MFQKQIMTNNMVELSHWRRMVLMGYRKKSNLNPYFFRNATLENVQSNQWRDRKMVFSDNPFNCMKAVFRKGFQLEIITQDDTDVTYITGVLVYKNSCKDLCIYEHIQRFIPRDIHSLENFPLDFS